MMNIPKGAPHPPPCSMAAAFFSFPQEGTSYVHSTLATEFKTENNEEVGKRAIAMHGQAQLLKQVTRDRFNQKG
jgi:hypothetical protein